MAKELKVIPLSLKEANEFITATAAADAAAVFGIALETVADGETGMVLVNVGIGGSPET